VVEIRVLQGMGRGRVQGMGRVGYYRVEGRVGYYRAWVGVG